jgi:CRISPR system Cascade subunit CasC
VSDREKDGRIAASIYRLAKHAGELHDAFDETPVACWAFGGGERVEPLTELGQRSTLDGTVRALGSLVADRLAVTV